MHKPRSRARVAAAFLGVAAFGATAVGIAGPAYADEGDSPSCYLSSGSVTVSHAGAPVSSVPYGTDLTITWAVYPECQDYAIFMRGPGFSGDEQVWGGSRSVWATPPDGSHSMTWTLEMEALDASSPFPWGLAAKTVNVT